MIESPSPQQSNKTSAGAWFVVSLLVAMLAAAMWGFYVALQTSGFPKISVHGWVAMAIGIIFSLLIGGGLMWLSFYSARQGFDDRADPGRLSKHDPQSTPASRHKSDRSSNGTLE